eukprot:321713-Chlamydomonas_euryale.AAC.1
MPSAWPSTGMRVERWMKDTSALPPRGITRSMTSSSERRSLISSRVWTSEMRLGPSGPIAWRAGGVLWWWGRGW